MVEKQYKYNFDHDSFYEDIELTHNKHETLDFDSLETDVGVGLSQENVHKLTEDLQNPLPPNETPS